MIPEAKKVAVANAMHAAFGVSEFEDISQLTAGLSSALIFRIVVKGKPYLLRVITRTDAMSDPTHYYASMKTGAAAGLAPHVWYVGTEDRISITDFIEAKPFPINAAREKLPALLKRLHSLPPFPNRMNYLDRMDGFVRKMLASRILPESMLEEAFQQYERIKVVYPRNAGDIVSCHNDLKPDNILFDGINPWFVDWEAAFLNDRYLDISVIGNFVVGNDNEEKDYLKRYFGDELNDYHHARFFLMSQMLHMFYTASFLLFSNANSPIDPIPAIPAFREFHNDVWTCKIDLSNNDAKRMCALVHLQRFKDNLKLKRFEDSMNIVTNHQWI